MAEEKNNNNIHAQCYLNNSNVIYFLTNQPTKLHNVKATTDVCVT